MIYLIGGALGGAGVWLAAALTLDHLGRTGRAIGTYDAIIVLGCRVLPDGSPSGQLARRIERAAELWREGRAPGIVLTGGGEPAEAAGGARHAVALGVPETALILEERSRTTDENARFSRELITGERVLLVTNSYHAPRSRWIFRRYFDEVDVLGVVAPFTTRVRNALREVLAWVWNLGRFVLLPRGRP